MAGPSPEPAGASVARVPPAARTVGRRLGRVSRPVPPPSHTVICMPSTSDTSIVVTDLLERPGASRAVDDVFSHPDELALELVEVRSPLRLQGVLEGVGDGVLVRGEISSRVELSCARCLSPVADELRVPVAELYSDPDQAVRPDDVEDGYEIRDGAIDVETLLRDALGSAAPTAPHCRSDCQGLCAGCGADLNADDCSCPDEGPDPRWAALAGLALDSPGADGDALAGDGRPGHHR